MNVELSKFAILNKLKKTTQSNVNFAAESSLLKTSSSFSLNISLSNLEIWKLNTLYLPFSSLYPLENVDKH